MQAIRYLLMACGLLGGLLLGAVTPAFNSDGGDWREAQAPRLAGTARELLEDDFSTGSVRYQAVRFRQSYIDQGWYANSNAQVGQGLPQSGWTITHGRLQNEQTANNSAGEGAVVQVMSAHDEGPELLLAFDYENSGNDTLYVHLWGFTGQFEPDDDNLGNFQASNGAYSNLAEDLDGNGQVNTYNLLLSQFQYTAAAS